MKNIIRISTGTYNTADYLKKIYKNKNSALKYLSKIGYPFVELTNFTWSNQGKNYTLSIG
jgi:hypothetical protein